MKVLDPNNTEHTIKLIPRNYDYVTPLFQLTNEVTKEVVAITGAYTTTDGILSIVFTQTFTEGSKYTFKIYEGTDVIYRGKIFITEQDTQEYKSSLNYIEYE